MSVKTILDYEIPNSPDTLQQLLTDRLYTHNSYKISLIIILHYCDQLCLYISMGSTWGIVGKVLAWDIFKSELEPFITYQTSYSPSYESDIITTVHDLDG